MDGPTNNGSPILTTGERAKEDGGRKRSLKHKHKQSPSQHSISTDSPDEQAKPPPKPQKDDGGASHLQELLTSKIAQLQVGDSSLDVDMGGIFSDAKLVDESRLLWKASKDEGDVARMDDTVHGIFAHMTQLQKKLSEVYSKYIVMREQKATLIESNMKVNATKGKLESLCRELQKQNKAIIAESRRIAEDENKKRQQLSQQFQTTIEDVSKKMEQQGKDYVASLQDNEALQTKLKTFLSQYELREEHYAHQLQAKDLAVQLAEAKLQHQIELTKRETEKVLDGELGLLTLMAPPPQVALTLEQTKNISDREVALQMSKHIKRLEKENSALKKKCDQYDHGAIEMLQERGRVAEEAKRAQDKISKLEGLCRMLQAERNRLKDEQNKETAPAS
ncbi:hypothetical protein DYB32_001627 [Aphanomyces invadans]|uniref:Uncharacterized protein n=1 Tax=Aphanomyces invadans TaxID=157072 RepID=A0A3R6YED3_9STRA|nr:hypothetical protein DYB32_001627 [Aphanomyces invadans]